MTTWMLAIAYYSVYTIGIGGLIILAMYISNKAMTALLSQLGIYYEFLQFMVDRRRKKKYSIRR